MAVTMSYGEYEFSPIPLVNSSREYKKTDDGRILNRVNKFVLDGTLVSTSNPNLVDTISDKDALSEAFANNGDLFLCKCDDTVVFSGYPRILSLSYKNTNNNWVASIGYTLELEYEDELTTDNDFESRGIYLDSASEDWNIEPIEDKAHWVWDTTSVSLSTRQATSGIDDSHVYEEESPIEVYKLTHNITAKGRTIYSGLNQLLDDKEAYQWAEDFCTSEIYSPGAGFDNVTVFYLPTGYLSNVMHMYPFNHTRTKSVNQLGGTFTVNENWLLVDTGVFQIYATEDFSIDIQQQAESELINVDIKGTIYGLEDKLYEGDVLAPSVSSTKIENAQDYWNSIKYKLLPRAQLAYENAGIAGRPLNVLRFNKSVGQNPSAGTISYSYGYNNKPYNCISGAFSENIQITVDNPNDVFANLTVLGRTAGPIIQLIGTRTAYNYGLSMDVVVSGVYGCSYSDYSHTGVGSPHNQVKAFITGMENSLKSEYGQLVKTADSVSWSPKEGKYGRRVQWTAVPCSGSGTDVSVLI